MRALILASALSGALTAQWAADCAAASARQVEALAAVPGTTEGRDPFQPVVAPVDERRDLPPLERVTLEELRLVATVRGIGPARALIEDASGLGFVTVVGTVVGVEHHKIVAIADGYIALEAPSAVAGAHVARVVTKLGHQLVGE